MEELTEKVTQRYRENTKSCKIQDKGQLEAESKEEVEYLTKYEIARN